MMSSQPPQVLRWDSNFLGFSVGQVAVEQLTLPEATALAAESRRLSIRLLYCLARPDDAVTAATMQQWGAPFLDRKVTYVTALDPAALAVADNPAIRPAGAWSEALSSMARQSGNYSRFRLDPRFAPGVFADLYDTWLRNSLSGELARTVLVHYAPDGTADGLLTLGEKNGRADIGLLAVDERSRRGHIGRQLVAQAQRLAYAWGYTELQAVTQQDNEPARRFYDVCGFRPDLVEHLYHLWLD